MAKKAIKPIPNQVQVPEAILEKIQKAHTGIMAAKLALADRLLALREAEAAVASYQATFDALVRGVGQKHGIDLQDPSKGRWNFDLPTGLITKVE